MVERMKYVSAILPDVLRHNVTRRRVRRLHFDTKQRRTAALDSLCNRISGGRGKDAVVVYGAAECSSGFGYFPGPVKELRKRLELHTRVVVLDEHNTSKRCSRCCQHGTTRTMEEQKRDLLPGYKENSDGKKVEIHGVRVCKNKSCGGETRWNRDINAARNMRQVFLEMLFKTNKVRPEPYQSPFALTASVRP
jgi:hypothetical protein